MSSSTALKIWNLLVPKVVSKDFDTPPVIRSHSITSLTDIGPEPPAFSSSITPSVDKLQTIVLLVQYSGVQSTEFTSIKVTKQRPPEYHFIFQKKLNISRHIAFRSSTFGDRSRPFIVIRLALPMRPQCLTQTW